MHDFSKQKETKGDSPKFPNKLLIFLDFKFFKACDIFICSSYSMINAFYYEIIFLNSYIILLMTTVIVIHMSKYLHNANFTSHHRFRLRSFIKTEQAPPARTISPNHATVFVPSPVLTDVLFF